MGHCCQSYHTHTHTHTHTEHFKSGDMISAHGRLAGPLAFKAFQKKKGPLCIWLSRAIKDIKVAELSPFEGLKAPSPLMMAPVGGRGEGEGGGGGLWPRIH